jgi:hypothetical protein
MVFFGLIIIMEDYKMNKTILTLLLTIIISSVALPLLSDGTWSEVKIKDGIKVLTRPVKGSEINEYMGVGIIEASLSEVNAVLDDLTQLVNWMPNCKVAKLIGRQSANHYFSYQVLKTPFIASDRDYVIETNIIITPQKITRTFKAVNHPDIPINEKLVRITELNGEWILTRKDDKTELVYRIRINPAGNLPEELINSSSQKLPYRTISNLITFIKKAKLAKK